MSDADHVQGTFNTPIPCPDCGSFMSTDYDPMGLPAAHCTNQTCPTGHLPDDWLIQNDYWEEDGVTDMADFDFRQVRHVSTDRDGIHLVTADDPDTTLCDEPAGGLTTFGDPVEGTEEAVRLGVWVNVRDGMCNDCRDQFNSHLFKRYDGGDC